MSIERRLAVFLVVSTAGFSTRGVGSAEQGPSIHAQYSESLKLLQDGSGSAALEAFQTLVERSPSFDRAYEKVVEVAQRLERPEAALEFFDAVLARFQDPHAYFGLALYHKAQARSRKQPEHLQSAEDNIRKCLESVGDWAPAYREMVAILRERGRLTEAFERLEPLARSQPDNAAVLYGLGYAHEVKNDLARALEYYDLAVQREPTLYVASRDRLVLVSLTDKLKALSGFRAMLDQVDPDDLERRGRISLLVGDMYMRLADYAQATECIGKATDLARRIGDRITERNGLSRLGFIYRVLGRHSLALESIEAAREMNRASGDRMSEGRLYSQIGGVHVDSGNYAQAIGAYLESRAIAREVGDRPSEIDQWASLGSVYRALGDYTKALEYVENAVALARELGDRLVEGRYLLQLGAVYENLGDPARALEAYENASKVSTGIGDRVTEALSSSRIGRVEADRGNHTAALRRYEVALHAAREIGAAPVEGAVLNDLGKLHVQLARYEEAKAAHGKALALGQDLKLPELTWRAHAGLASVFTRTAQAEALVHYRDAVSIIESVRGRVGTAEERAGFLQDKIDVYKELVGFLVSSHRQNPKRETLAEAFHYVERARGRAFLDLLAEAGWDAKGVTPELRARQRELEGQISQIQARLIQVHSAKSRDPTEIRALEASLARADEDYQNFGREVRAQHPEYAELTQPEAVTLSGAQGLLSDRSAILEYSLGREASYLFALGKNEAFVVSLPPQAEIETRVAKLRGALSQPTRTGLSSLFVESRELYRLLIEPAGKLLENARELIVVPDGALHYLPFEVLVGPGVPRDGYLVRDYRVSYVPSASVLARLDRRGSKEEVPPKALFALGDPAYGEGPARESTKDTALRSAFGGEHPWELRRLDHSGEEVRRIAELYSPDETTLLIGADATEAKVKSDGQLGQHRLLHFATHGLLNERKPQFSGLVLSQPGEEMDSQDGLLQVYEIFNLKLNADLVVLSACETGLGKSINGEGLVGLTRAFLYAGTPSVVVSLWKVADASTAELMVRFYKHLRDGKQTKADALRRAQLDLLRETSYTHPYYWAPFVLIGRP